MASLTHNHNIKLEATLQQLPLNLGGDRVETDMAARENGGRRGGCRGSSCHGGGCISRGG